MRLTRGERRRSWLSLRRGLGGKRRKGEALNRDGGGGRGGGRGGGAEQPGELRQTRLGAKRSSEISRLGAVSQLYVVFVRQPPPCQ